MEGICCENDQRDVISCSNFIATLEATIKRQAPVNFALSGWSPRQAPHPLSPFPVEYIRSNFLSGARFQKHLARLQRTANAMKSVCFDHVR
ncbi:hypothetical protein L226DRAFT_292568 [Lentinus tigrinus ALCF2SS1-7]|uniref:uncharacterized protein n=1 Tax=Lentinus tigrinus ALCF2SS1-7 TaxID=1328758 RepID=UPI001165CAEF|nr:hypothetical protein L226DRAFT_292568 [Lentinus tigrinus ALCF2SS1-7]